MPSPESSIQFDNEEFVDVVFGKPPKGGHEHPNPPKDKDFYEQAVETTSAHWAYPIVTSADALRHLYPKHSLVMSRDSSLNILSFPGVTVQPLEKTPLVTNLFYAPLSKKLSGVPGILVDQVQLGGFNVSWQGLDFIVYIIIAPIGLSTVSQTYILHEGPEEPARVLLLSAGSWSYEAHEEIWVYNKGYWDKDHHLWTEVQKADWKDVILKDEFKKALQKDIYGFFSSEKIYKDLGIPWKRGLILYGPPGNGKTISIKAIMKSCDELGFTPLYVKSFQNWAGEEAAMKDVFDKARQASPCVVVLEDLDSLINDQNRSFFLNQVDGLQGNDGLLLIGTTNHFERLDPGLSTRPSRFDRKFNFDDPDLEERKLYAQYWQKKLAGNPDVDFPDSLVQEVADLTKRFSFAYLKEAFVSTLVTLAGIEGEKPPFGKLIKQEISKLSKQLDKMATTTDAQTPGSPTHNPPVRPPRPNSATERDIRVVLDALSESSPRKRIFDTHQSSSRRAEEPSRDIRALIDALSTHLQTSASDASFRNYSSARIPGGLSTRNAFDILSYGENAQRSRSSNERYDRPSTDANQRLLDQIESNERQINLRLASLRDLEQQLNHSMARLPGGNTRPSPVATGTFPVGYGRSQGEPSGSDLA